MTLWTGTFQSSMYNWYLINYVHGEIGVKLPNDLKDTKNAVVELIYKGWYRAGDDIHPRLDYDMEMSEGTVSHMSLKCSMYNKQMIRFNIKPEDITHDKITGTYISYAPYDYGTFILRSTRT